MFFMADPILVEATGCASQPQFLCLKEGHLGELWVISGHDDSKSIEPSVDALSWEEGGWQTRVDKQQWHSRKA